MNHDMNKDLRILLFLVILIVVAISAALWATFTFWRPFSPWEPRQPPPQFIPGDIEFFYIAQTVVSSLNVTLSIFLLLTYVSIYTKTRSGFTMGLIIFSMVFLLNAVASNPLVIRAFGYRPLGLGPFAFLPELFSLAALAVLLYLSIRY
jgi:hypothetical protein